MQRIIDIKEISQILEPLKAQGKKIVATNGCFDILHVGHSRYLNESKKLGDILVLGLNSDSSVKELKGESRPINNQQDRAELLAELMAVDYVVIFDELTATNFLKAVKPDYYTKGGDYTQEALEKWPEYKTAKELGIEIVTLPFVQGKSSSDLIEKGVAS